MLCVLCTVNQSCPSPCDPMDQGVSARLLYWNFPGKNTGVVCHFFPEDLSYPGIKPMSLASPALVSGFFTTNAIWEAQWITKHVERLKENMKR